MVRALRSGQGEGQTTLQAAIDRILRNHDSRIYSNACRPYVSPSPMQMSLVDTHWKESQRSISLSKVIPHRLLLMTEGVSHALVQSLIHTACGYEAWRQLNGGSVARHTPTPDSYCHPLG
eukprot:4202392-Amphidinium_carterae.1